MRKKVWMNANKSRSAKPSESQKRVIIAACEDFIRDVLKPRFLAEIRPSTEFNYCVDIFGEWRAGRYRFMQRYRSDAPNRIRDEFDAPFVRIDYSGPDDFDIYWMRHNGQWHPVFQGVTLAQAFELMIDVPTLHPL